MKNNVVVEEGNVLTTSVDVLVLKHADGFYGADYAVAQKIGFETLRVPAGKYKFISTNKKISAQHVLVIGVGPLHEFEYSNIRTFAKNSIQLIQRSHPNSSNIGMTIHGPGYGLDDLAAMSSLMHGINDGLTSTNANNRNVRIIELNHLRAERASKFVEAFNKEPRIATNKAHQQSPTNHGFTPDVASTLSNDRIFCAMPFKNSFLDHWELAIQPAAHTNKLIAERLDHESFTGDIVQEIKRRIQRSKAVIALLDEENPNVFLEVGYAWGVQKPTVLALQEDKKPPFDVQGQRLIRYDRIAELKRALESEIGNLTNHP